MDTKHTPKKWKFRPGKYEKWCGEIVDGDGNFVASIVDHADRQANARIIAAAHETKAQRDALLAALEAIVQITDGSQPKDYPGALMVARAAIAAAKGEATE